MPKLSRGWIVSLIIFFVLLADQALKIWVKTHMVMHDSIHITDWFYLFFTENNGMAFGIELFDKLFLTLFRIAAVVGLFWYVSRIISKQTTRTGYLVCIALIIAGAMGNIIDCLFYGLVFSQSFALPATMFPDGGGYGTFFYGKVVDMLYFPLIDSHWPTWMPFVGGDSFVFFRPIFNIADSSISVGIFILLLFYRKDLSEVSTSKVSPEAPENQ
ncbi:MAG TPA: lipoprotein signal peptidase [Bacteroidales bacterium]|nr:lipoprotein signal peptidase [Bacteroidales bacterium]